MNKTLPNDRCPCGTGKRYKACCMPRAQIRAVNGMPLAKIFKLALEHHNANRLQQAEAMYLQVLSQQPWHVESLNFSGVIAMQVGNFVVASDRIRRAIDQLEHEMKDASPEEMPSLRRRYSAALNNLGHVRQSQGLLDQCVALYRRAMEMGSTESFNNYVLARQYDPHYTQEESFADHLAFARQFETPLLARWPEHNNPRDPKRRLRIGFVSGDLRAHPVGFFMESVLRNLDRSQLKIVLYCSSPKKDGLTERLRSLDVLWRDLMKMDDKAAVQRIRDDDIDILVDLAGHTGYNRLLTFARKPAPVQVTWLGYWSTTGLKSMDYILCDRISIPENEQRYFVEKPWYLPHTRLCFTAPNLPLPVAELPALRNGFITFGCFNNLNKMSDAVVALWSRLLHRIPDARLILKSRQLNEASMREAVLKRFAEHGIESGRLLMEGQSPRHEYLATYGIIDIALDPFPFTGATTSVEGLWMGVPFVTRRGDRLVTRQGESLLRNVGLDDWIAEDDEGYIECALRHAADLTRLAQLRAGLRERLLASPVCDAPQFARHLESAFRDMWRAYCAR